MNSKPLVAKPPGTSSFKAPPVTFPGVLAVKKCSGSLVVPHSLDGHLLDEREATTDDDGVGIGREDTVGQERGDLVDARQQTTEARVPVVVRGSGGSFARIPGTETSSIRTSTPDSGRPVESSTGATLTPPRQTLPKSASPTTWPLPTVYVRVPAPPGAVWRQPACSSSFTV